MNNNFYDGTNNNQNQNENGQTLNNTYSGYSPNNNNPNNTYGGYTQNYNNPFNTYGGYTQNNNQNSQYGYNNPNQNNGYNQNPNYTDNRYVGNSSYQNYGYGNNFNNQYSYNNSNVSGMQGEYFDSSDPVGAEVVYAKEKSNVKFAFVIMGVFIVFFVALVIYVLVCNKPAINVILAERIIPMLVLGVMCSVGLYLIIQPIFKFFVKKPRCTQPVTAKVVDVRVSRSNNGNKSYYPTYKYYYEGKIYIVSGKVSRTVNRPYKGLEVPIFVNQYNPTEYYIDTKVFDIVSIIFGIVFTVMSIKMFIPTISSLFI